MQYSLSHPVCLELHFSAHHHGDCVIVGSICGLCFAQSAKPMAYFEGDE